MKKLLLCTIARAFFILFLLPFVAHAGPSQSPFSNLEKGTYDIAGAYKAADLVVIGEVAGFATNGHDLRYHVEQVIKGNAGEEITLHGQVVVNTEMNGFSLPKKTKMLLLLKQEVGAENLYGAVNGFNTPGPIYFAITGDNVVLGEEDAGYDHAFTVSRANLKAYLDSNPSPLHLP